MKLKKTSTSSPKRHPCLACLVNPETGCDCCKQTFCKMCVVDFENYSGTHRQACPKCHDIVRDACINDWGSFKGSGYGDGWWEKRRFYGIKIP